MVFLYAAVPRQFSYIVCGLRLDIVVNLSVILASPVVVKVDILVDVFYAVASQFEHGEDEGLIVCGLDPSAVAVLHMFLFDLVEETDWEGAHMSELLADEAVHLVFDFSQSIGARVALLEVILVQLAEEMVGIGHSWLLGLIDHIEDLEDQLAQQFIVSAH